MSRYVAQGTSATFLLYEWLSFVIRVQINSCYQFILGNNFNLLFYLGRQPDSGIYLRYLANIRLPNLPDLTHSG